MEIPLYVKIDLDEAQMMLEEGNFNGAIKILEQLKQDAPEILIIHNLLGEAYIDNNNLGKAIKLYEELVVLAPKNIDYRGNLAQSYLMRGWHKKAVDTFKQAVALDEENIWLRLALSEAYISGERMEEAKKVLRAALSRSQVEENYALMIYLKLFIIDVMIFNIESMKENLKHMYELAANMPDEKEEIAKQLFAIAREMAKLQVFEVSKEILDVAWTLSPRNEVIKQLKDKIDCYQNIESEYTTLELDDDYDDQFVALIMSKLLPISDPDEEVYTCLIEFSFLKEFHVYQENILLLQKEYPKVYKEFEGYFQQMANKNNRNKKIMQNEKFLKKNHEQIEMMMLQQLQEIEEGDHIYFDGDLGEWDN